jgi:hypothetical protein
MLRIIRGAGKPYELLIQLSDVISAAVKVREVTGQLPTDVMVNVLQGESKTEAIWERYAKGEIDKAAIDRWQKSMAPSTESMPRRASRPAHCRS